MKRLIRKASQMFYHGTSLENLEKIISDGEIRPNASRGAGKNNNNDGSQFSGFTFFATTKEKAMSFATYIPPQRINAYAVLECNLDENSLLPDDDDMTSAKTWQDSANSIGQIKVDGSVSTNVITSIDLYNKWTGEFVLTTTSSSCMKDFENNITLFLEEWEIEERREREEY